MIWWFIAWVSIVGIWTWLDETKPWRKLRLFSCPKEGK